ncbi:MAG: 4Fe-4S dicluster domain-containing protein [bacterium]|nr:4Fe-4S dicluster domain-containing protein [bacterium]
MWSEEITRNIQTVAESLLREGKVDLVLGYQAGTSPVRTAPAFIRTPQEASLLVWNPFCENNLSVYLPRRKERVAIIAKGCDARAAVVAVQENQISRDRLVIVGLACSGIIDRRRLALAVEVDQIRGFSLAGDSLGLETESGGQVQLELSGLLADSCQTCTHRSAPIADIFIGQRMPEREVEDEFAQVRSFEALSSQERWRHFMDMAEKCIRCYACRSACPLCYCQECIVDQTQPQWFGKTTATEDVLAYHIMRAFHLAGRCVDCGACSRACPMGLDLRLLNKKLQKEVKELYQYVPGLSLEEMPALGTYRTDDPQTCITEK